jgi:hypothetical protein
MSACGRAAAPREEEEEGTEEEEDTSEEDTEDSEEEDDAVRGAGAGAERPSPKRMLTDMGKGRAVGVKRLKTLEPPNVQPSCKTCGKTGHQRSNHKACTGPWNNGAALDAGGGGGAALQLLKMGAANRVAERAAEERAAAAEERDDDAGTPTDHDPTDAMRTEAEHELEDADTGENMNTFSAMPRYELYYEFIVREEKLTQEQQTVESVQERIRNAAMDEENKFDAYVDALFFMGTPANPDGSKNEQNVTRALKGMHDQRKNLEQNPFIQNTDLLSPDKTGKTMIGGADRKTLLKSMLEHQLATREAKQARASGIRPWEFVTQYVRAIKLYAAWAKSVNEDTLLAPPIVTQASYCRWRASAQRLGWRPTR